MKGFNLAPGTPVDILLDKLRELGREEEAQKIVNARHQWYFGSYSFPHCDSCHVEQTFENRDSICLTYQMRIARDIMKKEQQELLEYQRLRAERERYRYLSEKFGDLE